MPRKKPPLTPEQEAYWRQQLEEAKQRQRERGPGFPSAGARGGVGSSPTWQDFLDWTRLGREGPNPTEMSEPELKRWRAENRERVAAARADTRAREKKEVRKARRAATKMRAVFGSPSKTRDQECSDSDLCHLCGEPLARDPFVYVFLYKRSDNPCDADLATPSSIGALNVLKGGVQHERCSRLTLAFCPHLRPGFADAGSGSADGTHRSRYWLAKVPADVWVAGKPIPGTGRTLLPDFDFEWVAVDATESAIRDDRKRVTHEGWDEFPRGLPRPLFDSLPVPYNTTAAELEVAQA
jgi:hypothetical protein